MNVARLVEQRRAAWAELDRMCGPESSHRFRNRPAELQRFAALYREACADLSLAEAWQLPPSAVASLQALVARAHHQLYRSPGISLGMLIRRALIETPRQVMREPAVHVCAIVFWGLALLGGVLAYNDRIWPDFAAQVIGTEQLEAFEQMYLEFDDSSGTAGAAGGGAGADTSPAPGRNFAMAGMYIRHNAGIGMQCFASMVLILPGFVTLAWNAVFLGAVDGYMLRPELGAAGINFRNFTTAHGPLELTAIVLSAGAGLKIGLGWFRTGGLRRVDSLVRSGRESLPIILCAVVLFMLAAVVEGFISPLPESRLPWWIKGLVGLTSSTILMFYFVILGCAWRSR